MEGFKFLFYFFFHLAFSRILKNSKTFCHFHWFFIWVFIMVAVVGLFVLGCCSVARDISFLRRFLLSSFFRSLSFLFL
jgi:hypothetical protein